MFTVSITDHEREKSASFKSGSIAYALSGSLRMIRQEPASVAIRLFAVTVLENGYSLSTEEYNGRKKFILEACKRIKNMSGLDELKQVLDLYDNEHKRNKTYGTKP